STILMNAEGIWLDAVHIGLQEKEVNVPNNTGEARKNSFASRILVTDQRTGKILANRLCEIEFSSGLKIEQKTDSNGYLYIESKTKDVAKIRVLFLSPKRLLTSKETIENGKR
ncbi:MAG: hypothetical protein Q4B95_10375, partial [Lonepinella koalarum]|nr:hypothetical protein [Lonepinella koalarum]